MSQNCRRRDLIHMRRVRRWYRQIYGAESGFTRRQKTGGTMQAAGVTLVLAMFFRSEESRVGKECYHRCSSRGGPVDG